MFSNNVDLTTNNRNYGKPFWILCAPIASIGLFQVDIDKSWNYLWYCYVKDTCAPVAPPQRSGGSAPVMHPRSGVPERKWCMRLSMKHWHHPWEIKTMNDSEASCGWCVTSYTWIERKRAETLKVIQHTTGISKLLNTIQQMMSFLINIVYEN